MRWLLLALLATIAGCYHHIEAASADAAIDALEIDAGPCTGTVYGTGLLQVCLVGDPAPSGPIDSIPENTDQGFPVPCTVIATAPLGIEVCVIAMQNIEIRGMVRAFGSRPLAFLGTDSLIIDAGAIIDVSSATGGTVGAGAAMFCTTGRGDTGGTVSLGASAGGGAAGANGGPGGAGGSGDFGAGASATTSGALTTVTGGCAGGNGGSSGGYAGGTGGAGGGAVYLISNGAITVSGRINASGAGGTLARPQTGGAGGGAGGLIALDGTSYVLDAATMFAIGGSGSTGGGAQAGGYAGMTATTPNDTTTPQPPNGGGNGGIGTGGDGLAGGTGTKDATTMHFGGGGGGGGGGGYIVAKNAPINVSSPNIVPPITEMP